MRQLQKVGIYFAAVIFFASCTEHNPANFNMEKPQSIAVQDSLDNNYNPLKTYVDSVNSSFRVGAGVSASVYGEQGTLYRMVNSNFQQVTAKDIGHGTVAQGDGSLALESMNSLIDAARQAGISVYGNALISRGNENEAYLNELIAPDRIESSEPSWEVVTSNDFETDDLSNIESNSNAITSYTAVGGGANGEGRALSILNEEVRADNWRSQFFLSYDPHMEEGQQYRLTMDVRADDEGVSFSTQAHDEPGGYLHWSFFNTITAPTDWFTYVSEITVSENQAGAGAIAFNLGDYATTYYVDNITLEWFNEEGGVQLIPKSPEEKEQILSTELESYVSTMIDTASYVDSWEIISEPIAETNPMSGENGFNLKTSDEFNWNEYLSTDYGVQAYTWAREFADQDDQLFISDYGLESNLAKCDALINYVNYIEDNGTTIDGISTKMHISINTSEQNITQMFEKLAATGKMVNVSELYVGLGGISAEAATPEIYEAQSDMYRYVVDQYFEIVPEDQRYGITVWSPLNTEIGLWDMDYNRKRAYGGFATGLKNGFNSSDN